MCYKTFETYATQLPLSCFLLYATFNYYYKYFKSKKWRHSHHFCGKLGKNKTVKLTKIWHEDLPGEEHEPLLGETTHIQAWLSKKRHF